MKTTTFLFNLIETPVADWITYADLIIFGIVIFVFGIEVGSRGRFFLKGRDREERSSKDRC